MHPHPLNPRRNPGADLDELARSVKTLGVLEPLVVVPRPEGDGYLVAFGSRRREAAARAGRATAPCLVRRDLSPRAVAEAALAENVARSSLTVIEEALGYLSALEVGSSASRLARAVGRPVRHVRGRLALLELPPVAQDAVEAGILSLADAEALGRIKDDPDLVAEVLALPSWERRDLTRVVERRLERRTTEAAVAAACAAEEARGRRVLAGHSGAPPGSEPLRRLGLDPTAHEAEPCHAVVVAPGYGPDKVDVAALCTEPRRHTAKAKLTNRSALQVTPVAAEAGRSAEDRHRRADRRRVAARRADFLAGALGGGGGGRRPRLPKAEVTAFALRVLVDRAGAAALAHAGKALGVAPAAYPWGGGADWSSGVVALAERSPADLVRVAYAVACGEAEQQAATYGSYRGVVVTYLDSLAALGYGADPFERAELARAAAPEVTAAPGGAPTAATTPATAEKGEAAPSEEATGDGDGRDEGEDGDVGPPHAAGEDDAPDGGPDEALCCEPHGRDDGHGDACPVAALGGAGAVVAGAPA